MDSIMPVLSRSPLFRGVNPDQITAMCNCLQTHIIKVSKNECVFREGDPAREVGIVLSGSVQIVREDYYGNRSILGTVESSGLFGEAYACADVDFPVSVIAAEESRILLADCKKVMTVCSNSCTFHNQLIYNMLQVVAKKNIQLNQKMELMSKRTTREKLLAYLWDEAKKAGCESFIIPFNRQELADYLGAERSALSAEISKMREEGLLLCKKSQFTLLPAAKPEI